MPKQRQPAFSEKSKFHPQLVSLTATHKLLYYPSGTRWILYRLRLQQREQELQRLLPVAQGVLEKRLRQDREA